MTADLISSLTDLGGLGLFVGFVLVAAIGLYRQWWVPGWLWRRTDEARLTAEGEVRKQAGSIRRLTMALERERRRRRTDRTPPDA